MELSWKSILGEELGQPYMVELRKFIGDERSKGKEIFPTTQDMFSAFELTPFHEVRVVVLGQDPYTNPGQAHGLSFSVTKGLPVPPSLRRVFSEVGIPKCTNGCLTTWAVQGVLLLNNVLTVERGKPKSHYGKGWEVFTDRIIKRISDNKEHVVFMLWGNEARNKKKFIDRTKHLVVEAPHPSPLTGNKGFLGCNHFNLCNGYLTLTKQKPINWHIVSQL